MAVPFDTICQYAIPLFTLSGIFLIARKMKWGFVVSLLSQPFWYFTAYTHDQWGVFFNTMIYSCILLYGTYNWFYGDKEEKKGN